MELSAVNQGGKRRIRQPSAGFIDKTWCCVSATAASASISQQQPFSVVFLTHTSEPGFFLPGLIKRKIFGRFDPASAISIRFRYPNLVSCGLKAYMAVGLVWPKVQKSRFFVGMGGIISPPPTTIVVGASIIHASQAHKNQWRGKIIDDGGGGRKERKKVSLFSLLPFSPLVVCPDLTPRFR